MTPDLKSLPEGMVLKGDEPVFTAPWEAQAFAMVIHLHQQDLFTWAEWAEHLSAQIHSGVDSSYYEHWLAALESITQEKAQLSGDEIDDLQQAWLKAAHDTPHGEPIELAKAVRSQS